MAEAMKTSKRKQTKRKQALLLTSKTKKATAGVNKGDKEMIGDLEDDSDSANVKRESRLPPLGAKRASRFLSQAKEQLGSRYAPVGHRELSHKMRRRLVGVAVLVASSTLLLLNVNVAAFFVHPDKLEDLWFNVYDIGFNLGSVLSNAGILFVCGIGSKRVAGGAQTKTPKAAVAPGSHVANASSVHTASEVGVEPTGQKTKFCDSLSLPQVQELDQSNNSSDSDSSSQAGEDAIQIAPTEKNTGCALRGKWNPKRKF
jgi:hypothetical protein